MLATTTYHIDDHVIEASLIIEGNKVRAIKEIAVKMKPEMFDVLPRGGQVVFDANLHVIEVRYASARKEVIERYRHYAQQVKDLIAAEL